MRPSAEAFKKKAGDRAVRVMEIGVLKGQNAGDLLRGLNVERMYLVDRWNPRYENGKYHVPNMLDFAMETFKRFTGDDRVVIIRADSLALEPFGGRPFDYIYLDGDHSYPHVYKEIRMYWDALMPGGMLAGDNYEIGDVRRAVREFFPDRTPWTQPWKTAADGKTSVLDWWMWKGEQQ